MIFLTRYHSLRLTGVSIGALACLLVIPVRTFGLQGNRSSEAATAQDAKPDWQRLDALTKIAVHVALDLPPQSTVARLLADMKREAKAQFGPLSEPEKYWYVCTLLAAKLKAQRAASQVVEPDKIVQLLNNGSPVSSEQIDLLGVPLFKEFGLVARMSRQRWSGGKESTGAEETHSEGPQAVMIVKVCGIELFTNIPAGKLRPETSDGWRDMVNIPVHQLLVSSDERELENLLRLKSIRPFGVYPAVEQAANPTLQKEYEERDARQAKIDQLVAPPLTEEDAKHWRERVQPRLDALIRKIDAQQGNTFTISQPYRTSNGKPAFKVTCSPGQIATIGLFNTSTVEVSKIKVNDSHSLDGFRRTWFNRYERGQDDNGRIIYELVLEQSKFPLEPGKFYTFLVLRGPEAAEGIYDLWRLHSWKVYPWGG